MKYDRADRLRIGELIYTGEISLEEAAQAYGINKYTARDYYRAYKAGCDTGEKGRGVKSGPKKYRDVSRSELIDEIIFLRCKLMIAEGMPPVEVVDRLSEDFSITSLCRYCGISRNWYYMWKRQSMS